MEELSILRAVSDVLWLVCSLLGMGVLLTQIGVHQAIAVDTGTLFIFVGLVLSTVCSICSLANNK